MFYCKLHRVQKSETMALQEEMERQGNWLFRNRSFLPILPLVIAFGLYLRMKIYPEIFVLEETQYEIFYEMFAVCVSLTGFFIRIVTIGFAPENTSGRNTKAGQLADTLNTTGIYSAVRHPLYFGNFLMWFGISLWTGHFWFIISFCLFYWIYYERIMFAEECFLRRKFGKDYLTWSENTPAFLPKFKNFKKSTRSFNWRKVLRQEKNGLFALFLIFCSFNIIGEIVAKGMDYNFFLMVMTVLTGLSYFYLKYLKNRTTILNDL